MDSSSQLFGGGTEECHSSESGWTMYIGSPIHSDTGDYGDDDDDKRSENGGHDDGGGDDDSSSDANREDDSDDSMASDASSGPSHQYGNGGGARFKHEERKINGGYYSEMRGSKAVMGKQRAQRGIKEEKVEERVVMSTTRANTAPAHQSASKARKSCSIWMGKRK